MTLVGTVRTVVGIIGNVISMGLFLSPAPTVARICKSKNVEGFHPYIFIAGLLNCGLWVFYGSPAVHPNSTLVWTINSAGIVLYFIYLIIYGIFVPTRQRLVLLGLVAVAGAAMVTIALPTLKLVHTTELRSTIIGSICIVFNIALYASPLTVIRKVFQTKNIEYLPFWVCIANLANGIIWTAYSLLPLDINILICNGVGTVLALFQVGLQWQFEGFPHQKKAVETVDAKEVQLQNKTPV